MDSIHTQPPHKQRLTPEKQSFEISCCQLGDEMCPFEEQNVNAIYTVELNVLIWKRLSEIRPSFSHFCCACCHPALWNQSVTPAKTRAKNGTKSENWEKLKPTRIYLFVFVCIIFLSHCIAVSTFQENATLGDMLVLQKVASLRSKI